MKILITKKQKLNYLKKFHQKVKTINNPDYVLSKRDLISQLEWLIAYYEGRTGCTPKELLESYISNTLYLDMERNNYFKDIIDPIGSVAIFQLNNIAILYNWVYYKKIVGF